MKIIANIIASIAWQAALSAAGSASEWHVYQSREPAILRELLKNKQ